MSSSISSSDIPGGGRRIYLRILLAILLGMGMALLLVRLFVAANGAGSQSLLGRVFQAQAAIPQIVSEPNDLVMFFGSSMVHEGFSPREFDRHLADMGINTSAFNFGFGGLNPLFQSYVSRRIAEKFEAHDRRLKLALIEFNPFQTTKARRRLGAALEESYIGMLASPRELFDIFLKDPGRALRMLQIRYLRDGISAEMITTFLWAEPFQAPADSSQFAQDEAVEARLGELSSALGKKFAEEYPDYDGSDWYYPWRGGGTLKSERSAETLALFDEYYRLVRNEYAMDEDRLSRIRTADIIDLNFDPELVAAFISIVRDFQRISENVEIVLLPKNTDWIRNPPEAMARQAAVLERIGQETGVTIRNFQQIDTITNDMFRDTTHLNRYYGSVEFSHYLAEYYAELLR